MKGNRPLYMLPVDPLAEEVLIPGFRASSKVDCMVGFFSSEILASLAPGLATYIVGAKNKFRLVISPLLRAEDQSAIEDSLKSPEEIADKALEDLTVIEDLLQRYTLKCLSWLLRESRIEIKIALMKGALFHLKVWLFEDNNDVIAVHGSSNATASGIYKNIEQIIISRSWRDSDQHQITNKFRYEFNRFWENKNDDCLVIDIPEAVRQRLLRTYSSEKPPTENELRALYGRATVIPEEDAPLLSDLTPVLSAYFAIPDWLEFEKGPFEHQGKAVVAWCDAGYRGVLEMATGSGKTITSMIGAYRLWEENKPLLIVVAAPYVPLIEQWCDEITSFGLKPVNLSAVKNATKRESELQKLMRRVRNGLSDVEIVVVSHDTLCTQKFLTTIKAFNCKRLLIADEVHNLGRPSFFANRPEFFEYRLGLSATPIRQYDEQGTYALFEFFGPIAFSFTLKKAIGRCLVEYDYHVHTVHLSESEMDDWFDLTGKIKQNAWRKNGDNPDEYLAKLMRDRRALLETASGKVAVLDDLLSEEDKRNLKYTLIYTSDKGPEQIINVNRLLRNRNFLFHQLTAKETANREEMKRVIKSFQDGDIQVLTAKRVLDEGVNIPQICKAFILASTTVERQWVQRRGRLLRTCNAIEKTHSVIHDLLVLPPRTEEGLDFDAHALVNSELHRALEFASLARNAGRLDGPLPKIRKIVKTMSYKG